jgi:hypothetical protein
MQMIETECFGELNVMYTAAGELVEDLRPLINNRQLNNHHSASSSSKSPGFLSRLFKKRVSRDSSPFIACSVTPHPCNDVFLLVTLTSTQA